MNKTVTGVFKSYEQAMETAATVKEAGLRSNDISIIARGENENRSDPAESAVEGGILGGVTGLMLGLGTMAIPGFGVVAAAGPVVGLLSGTLTGGIVGGLIDLGIPEHKGKEYENDIREGRVLWSMKTPDNSARAVEEILRRSGAEKVETHLT